MTFKLSIPQLGNTENSLEIPVSNGQQIYVLGANGAGKSSLMHHFYVTHAATARRITAHRQNWFVSNAVSLSPQNKADLMTNIANTARQPEARWTEWNAEARPSVAIYDLLDAINVRARGIADAVDQKNNALAEKLSIVDAPIKQINELLRLSNIRIEISVEQHDRVVAKKRGSKPYSIAELSDGERNALLIAAEVLTAPSNTLILLDEPERHLHRAISAPLLKLLFAKRSDCAFVVSTHDVSLCVENPDTRRILVRACDVSAHPLKWSVDLISSNATIDDALLKDILGARRQLIFIEGDEKSLDKPLYSLVFPDISIIPKASSREVERAVYGIRNSEDFNWLRAFGIVDNDRRSQSDVDKMKAAGVHAIAAYSVEAIYYHPEIQSRVAIAHAGIVGADAAQLLEKAKAIALSTVTQHAQRLSERALEKVLRENILCQLPGKKEIAEAKVFSISIDIPSLVSSEMSRLQGLLDASNITEIIARYPVRETQALQAIAKELGFQSREQYESSVRTLLARDSEALELVRSMFDSLTPSMAESFLSTTAIPSPSSSTGAK